MPEIRTVLLIDDEPDIRMLLEMCLREVAGWEAFAVPSGFEALKFLKTQTPDVILLDVMMPEMDGPTVLKEIRRDAALREIPVVFMTAKVQRHEIARYLSLGAKGVIAKPFDPLELPSQLLRLLAGSSE